MALRKRSESEAGETSMGLPQHDDVHNEVPVFIPQNTNQARF
jgi:hypothetical protein